MSNLALGTQAWVDRINAAYRKSATAFIDTGNLLIECKKTVLHGEWLAMLKGGDLDFEERQAQRLMKIARDQRLSNPTILSLLPNVCDRLYKLTKLSDDELKQELTGERPAPQPRRLSSPSSKPATVTEAEYEEVTAEHPGREKATGSGEVDEQETGQCPVSAPPPAASDGPATLQAPTATEDREEVAPHTAVSDAAEHDATAPASTQADPQEEPSEFVTFKVRADNPALKCKAGFALLIGSVNDIDPVGAAAVMGDVTPEDFTLVIDWLMAVEAAVRAARNAALHPADF